MNSIKARLDIVTGWLANDPCDALLVQETKSQDVNFPVDAFQAMGWHVAFYGQKSYNGVAIASRFPIEDVVMGLDGDAKDEQARYMEATINSFRVATIYLPNGNPAPGPKFDYKLGWMARLEARALALLNDEKPVVLGGDFNVIPDDIDCYDPAGWAGDALTRPESRSAFRSLLNKGYADALRSLNPTGVFIAIGIIKLVHGNAIMAYGLIICCCHPKRLTASKQWELIAHRAGWKSHLTIPLFGAS